MNKKVEFSDEQKLKASRDCYFGFLNEFLESFKNYKYTDAVDLLKEEITLTSENQIHENDKTVLEKLNTIKELIINGTNNEVIRYVENEIRGENL